MTFQEKLNAIVKKNNSLVCVGLDSDVNKIPEHLKSKENAVFEFNKAIVDATHDLVCAYKPNSAFYEARGEEGIRDLKMTFNYINNKYPEVFTIIDAKRADIGNTNDGYAKYAFDFLKADGITLHPYLGREAMGPFLQREDKVSIILCRTSNPGAGEFQDIVISNEVRDLATEGSVNKKKNASLDFSPPARNDKGVKLYQYVASQVAKEWNKNNNCMLVVGATYPQELAKVRKIVGDEMTLLVPGIGAQGGDVEKTVKAGLNSKGAGMIINSSRGIIFASSGPDFAEVARQEAKKLKEEINKYR